MAGWGLQQTPARLPGREQECAVVGRLLAGARAGAGGQLYLSPRTVDYHLRKVFTKLGIASRTELVRDGLHRPSSA